MRKYVYTAIKALSLFTLFMLPASLLAQQWNFRTGFGSSTAGQERGLASTTDASGNVYIAGVYIGSVDFGTGALPVATANEGFVAKFNSSGVCQWSVGFAASGNDQAQSITTDGTNVYVGGFFSGSITIAPLSPVTATGVTGFVAKLSASNGAGQWISKIEGGGTENVQSLCLDNLGNLYAAGNFAISATFNGGFSRTANGGSSTDMFVARLNPGTGAFDWVSTGGALNATDSPNGSGIAFVQSLNEIVYTGSYNNATATYSTASPASLVSLTNAGSLDICFLEINATNGAFLEATGVGNTGLDDGVALVYDPSTTDIMATGYYASTTLTFGSNPPLTNEGNNDAWYARFTPGTNTFVWSKSAGGSAGADRAYDIATTGTGALYVVGTFRGTLDLPTTLTPFSITNNNTADDIFLARINAADGNGQLLAQGAGPVGNTISNVGFSAAAAPGKIWITGSYSDNITFSPLAPLPATAGTADILLAQFNDPAALSVTPSQTAANCSVGCNGTATVTVSGGVGPYTYAWTPNVSTTNSATGLCPGATLSVVITDAIGNTNTQNFTITPASQLASANTANNSFAVSATNNFIFDASCNLIAKLVPSGGAQVSGNVSAKVWIEPSVKTDDYGVPYVQRHYEIMPATNAANATATVTLYFTQAEFNTFNAFPGVTALLPVNSGDAAGKARVRLSKLKGTSSNGTGLPASYSNGGSLVDPVDANIVYNATAARWEITFDVVGFSGFFLQTTQAVLPVVWQSVNGSLDDQGKVNLTWKVQEQDVASYTIERSTDGEHYTAIGTVTSQGDGEHSYSFREATALAGKASYRIKQTDLNGRSAHSKVILLNRDRQGWVSLYPNPVKGSATLNVTDKDLINTTAVLYDGTGREMQRLLITQAVTTIRMDHYNSGVYTLRLKNGQAIRIVKE